MPIQALPASDPIRVLLLSTDLQPGGYPLRLERTARRLPAEGVRPIVGSLAPRGPLHAELEAQGIETFDCGARGSFDLGCLRRFGAVVRRFDPDVVHAGLFHANVAARLFGRAGRPRPIITSSATIEIERRWHRWGEALTAGLSDRHLANSSAVADHLVRDLDFDPARVVVVPNGLDFDAIDRAPVVDRESLGVRSDVPLIAWAGRMDPVKDLDTFLDVVAGVRRSVAVMALMVGDGPQRARLQRGIERRGLGAAVVVAGWRTDAVSCLRAADVLLFPSRTEGSPNVVLEAMAAGCVVVASDIPACSAIIESGISGLLCPVADVGSMTGAVLRLLTDPPLRRRLAEAARSHVRERHEIGAVTRQLAGVYRSVLVGQSGVP